MADSIGRASVIYILKAWLLLPIGIVSSVVVARALGPEVKGLLAVFTTTQAVLLVPAPAIQMSLVHFIANRRPDWGKIRTFISLFIILQATISVGLLGLIIQVPAARAVIFSGLRSAYLIPIFLTVCANIWIVYRLAVLSGLQMYSRYVVWGTVGTLINNVVFISGLGLLWVTGMSASLAGVIALSVCASLTSAAALGIATGKIRVDDSNPTRLGEILPAVSVFAAPVLMRGLVEWLNLKVDVYFVNFFAGARELGLYTVAVGLAQLMWVVPISIAGPLFSKVSKDGDTTDSRERVRYLFRATALLSILIGVAIAVATPFLLPLAYGEQYRGSVILLLVLLPGTICLGPTRVIISYFSGKGSPRESLRAELVGMCVTVTLDLLLIPRFGAVGAACASCVAYILYSCYICRRFLIISGTRWPELLMVRGSDWSKLLHGLGNIKGVSLLARPWRQRFTP